MFRVGDSPRPGQKYIRRRGVYAVLSRGNDLLLTAQTDGTGHLDLQLPGGGIDPGEHPITALHREVFEETGWHIANPRRIGAFQRYTYMPEYDLWAEKICLIYSARPISQICPPIEPDHVALWLCPDDAIDKLGNQGDRAFVAQHSTGTLAVRWMKSQPFSARRQVTSHISDF
jgi:8-oxo-dGTP diphosphatase